MRKISFLLEILLELLLMLTPGALVDVFLMHDFYLSLDESLYQFSLLNIKLLQRYIILEFMALQFKYYKT